MRTRVRSWLSETEGWYAAVFLANLVMGTSSVLIPLSVSEVFGRSAGSLGFLASAASFAGLIGSLIWGRASDAVHRRKPFVVASYAASAASFVAISFSGSFDQLLGLNMFMNFFWVASAAVTVLLVIENRDQSTWEGKIGRLNQIGAIGWLSGLLLGSGLLTLAERILPETGAIRVLFLVSGMASMAAAFLAGRLIPRTRPVYTRRRFLGAALALGNLLIERARFAPFHIYHRFHPRRVIESLSHPDGFLPGTKRFLASTFVAFAALGMFGIPLPLLLVERFSLPASSVFLYFTIQQLGVIAAYPIAARRIKRRGNKRVQTGSLLIRALLFGGSALFLGLSRGAPPPWVMVPAFLVYGITWSFFQLSGVALTSRLAKRKNRGLALGAYNALAGAGWIVAGIGSGLLARSGGYELAFAGAAILLVLSLGILRTVPEPQGETAKRSEPRPAAAGACPAPHPAP